MPRGGYLKILRKIAVNLEGIDKSLKRDDGNENLRSLASDLRQLGNLILGATVLAQVFSKIFEREIAFWGITVFVFLYWIAYILTRGGEK